MYQEMFLQELSIETKSKASKDEVMDEFMLLMGAYRQNGQCHGGELYYIDGDFVKSHAQTLEKESLNKKYNDTWVNECLKKLEKLTKTKLKINLLGLTHQDCKGDVCRCNKHAFFTLYTHLFNDMGPLDCGTCLQPIALYKIPELNRELKQMIFSWEANYKACDRLQINPVVGEKWATKQMSDHDSELSVQGRDLCQKITEATGVPAYYYLFNYRKLKLMEDKKRKCPSCNKSWLLKEPLNDLSDFKCDGCKLVSSLTSNGY